MEITIEGKRMLVEKMATLLTHFNLETAVYATNRLDCFRGVIRVEDLEMDERLNKIGREVMLAGGAPKAVQRKNERAKVLPFRRRADG